MTESKLLKQVREHAIKTGKKKKEQQKFHKQQQDGFNFIEMI